MLELASITTNAPNGDRPTCLILHGLGGGPYELEPLLEKLRTEGFTFACPILPGHAGPGLVMPASRWPDWVAAAEKAFDDLSALGGPLAVIGFSTGATIALQLTRTRPVARQVLLAPFLAIRYTRYLPIDPVVCLRWMAKLFPDLPRRRPAVRDRHIRDIAAAAGCFRTFSVPSAFSALELIAELRPEIPRIQTPTLIIQGKRDSVVEPGEAAWLHEHLGSPEKRLVYLEESEHLVALDRQRDRAISETMAFLTKACAPCSGLFGAPADWGART
jgi:carboxylesterase